MIGLGDMKNKKTFMLYIRECKKLLFSVSLTPDVNVVEIVYFLNVSCSY